MSDAAPAWLWMTFATVLTVFLGMDLFLHRGHRESSRRAAVVWSVVWIAAGLLFAVLVWGALGDQRAIEYIAAYAIEKSLSLDNLFVFLIIFKSLSIPKESQRTALSWGVFGALVFRAIFIFLGAAALQRWEWIVYVFAVLLLVAAWRAFRGVPKEEQENALVSFLARYLPMSKSTTATSFFVREGGAWRATRLFLAVLALELTDILFAIDSVPAALAISRNEFIVYSSNAFAILGLRSLYIVMAHTIAEMRYLHYGLAGVLAFAAFKLLMEEWIQIPPPLSVAILLVLIGGAVGASLRVGGAQPSDAEPPATT
jgi:tellurite resistance protein TerC